jgi:hypothetical protein
LYEIKAEIDGLYEELDTNKHGFIQAEDIVKVMRTMN